MVQHRIGSLAGALRVTWRDSAAPCRVSSYALLLVLVLCGCIQESEASQSKAAASQKTGSKPIAATVNEPCASVHGSSLMGHTVAKFDSEQLSAAMPGLQHAIESGSKAAYGTRPWGGEGNGIAGATFGLAGYRLGADECTEELKKMTVAVLSSDIGADLAFSEVRPLRDADVAAIGEAFDAWVRTKPEDDRAVAALARAVKDAITTYPNLLPFAVRGGGTVARNAGAALVDVQTREALWLFARAVRMSTRQPA
jgi:hypothetical protein